MSRIQNAFKLLAVITLIYIYASPVQIAAQIVPASEVRLTPKAAPAPISGRYKFYVDVSTGLYTCIAPNGSNCIGGGTGTVTSVGLTMPGVLYNASVPGSPITTSGTLAPTLKTQVQKTVLAGPASGADAAPTFRTVAYSELTGLPTLAATTTCSSTDKFSAYNASTGVYTCSADVGGGSGTVTTFTTTTWPSWLTPTVTNASTTPNLNVAAGTVPVANGGTGATTQQAAINALTGSQTSGFYLRSNGTNAALGALQAGDVPTLNQNTTGKATSNVASFSNSVTGGLTVTPANTNLTASRTTAPANITIVAFTMALGTAFTGCATFPTYQLFDVTSSTVLSTITMTTGTLYYANTGLSAAVASGHDIVVRVGTAAVTCTNGQSATWTAWFSMT